MLECIDKYFPEGTKHSFPDGGLFTWVELPGDIDTAELLKESSTDPEVGVAFVAGAGFVDLEVMNPATNKGLALAALCRALGVPAEQVMAIGDSGNDAAMLEARPRACSSPARRAWGARPADTSGRR